MVLLHHGERSRVRDNRSVSKWKIRCGGLAAVVAVGVAIGAIWAYLEFRSEQVVIRNDTEAVVNVFLAGDDLSVCPQLRIGAGETRSYRDSGVFCHGPILTFSAQNMPPVVCDWSSARESQPVVVKAGFVSCYGDVEVLPTFVSPPSAFASPTPEP